MEFREQHHHAHEHPHIAHTSGQERLLAGVRGGVLLKPEPDEQIGTQSNKFPADIDAQQVVGHDEEQHRKGE